MHHPQSRRNSARRQRARLSLSGRLQKRDSEPQKPRTPFLASDASRRTSENQGKPSDRLKTNGRTLNTCVQIPKSCNGDLETRPGISLPWLILAEDCCVEPSVDSSN